VIQMLASGIESRRGISEAVPSCQLREQHREHLIPAC
jgi:hypothetical protein